MALDGRLAREIEQRRQIMLRSRARRTRKKAPRAAVPRGIARDYGRALIALMRPLDEIIERRINLMIPELVEIAPLPRSDSVRMDASAAEIIARTMRGIRVEYAARVSPQRLAEIAEKYGTDTARFNRQEVNRQFRSVLGVDFPGSDPNLRDQLELFRKANVQLITGATEEQLTKIENTLTAAARTGSRAETIQKEIQERLGVTKSRASFIARDQVLKMNGELTQLRQREAGVQEYEWVTSDDGEVRLDHAALNGTIQRWDKPPIVDRSTGRRAHPGEDYQCRCTAIPIIKFPV